MEEPSALDLPSVPVYHNYLTSLVAEANVVAMSIDYRLAPEHPLPIAYEDSWAALEWVASHYNGQGPEAWLNDHADFQRVFVSEDSAGANIAHNMAVRAGVEDLEGSEAVRGLFAIRSIQPSLCLKEMDSSSEAVAYEFLPYFRAYRDGRVERLFGTDIVPASIDSQAAVSTKDIIFLPESGVSARLFIPSTINAGQKLPLLVYFHGGAFCFGSPFCAMYHNYLTSLVAEANVVAMSVDYRLAPENPLPIAYEDSWAALKWVASHCNGRGPEPWLNDHADFQRVFVAGDSAGANIAHNMTVRAGVEDLEGVKLLGACLVHPDFVSREGRVSKAWFFACPTTTGSDDPRINPAVDPRLSRLGCSRVVVCVADKDGLRERGWFYYEMLKKSGWGGMVEIVETEGEEHVFHLFNPTCDKAVALLQRLAFFMNQD
ncbi:hypothetical protein F0562_028656 [Nyssa sinensis]|uniref:Alpha/beta hydrolase fold-3 domain-containing protein n=1 Tax=Nyssa sinensis TaxID=561372 RepID=A0A5J5B0T4_9ASTE|nr:hypothetical protein F0562_028656 [Nyssa sinensis]